MNAIIMKSLILGLFLIFLPMIFAQTSCCQTMKANLEHNWQGYQNVCNATCPGYALSFKGDNIGDYAITIGGPPMTATTACFWAKTQTKGRKYFISYAVPGYDNNFLIGVQYDLRLWIHAVLAKHNNAGRMSSSHGIQINDGKWHHVCATWKSLDGHYQIYKDGNIAGDGFLHGTIGVTLSGGGTWILGQEQDRVGGGFDIDQSMQGEITDVNIWHEILTPEVILLMSKSCQSILKGNVKPWNDFKSGVKGNVKTVKPTCCVLF